MVYITGDCHGHYEKLSNKKFKVGKTLKRNDIVIVCGDFGIWHKNPTEKYWLDCLSKKPYTICFCDGNHENFDRLNSEYKVVDFCGGKAHKIRHNIFHLMRGEIFEFNGEKYFVFGGAKSHDIQDGILDRNDYETEEEFNKMIFFYRLYGKMFRVRGLSWWDAELPTQDEIDYAKENLKKVNYKVDYVISHCCPHSISSQWVRSADEDILTQWFDELKDELEFKRWYCGHYHLEQNSGKFTVLYDSIIESGNEYEQV